MSFHSWTACHLCKVVSSGIYAFCLSGFYFFINDFMAPPFFFFLQITVLAGLAYFLLTS